MTTQIADTPRDRPLCGKAKWPYTENNICVLKSGHKERLHKDRKGREFDHGIGYVGTRTRKDVDQ